MAVSGPRLTPMSGDQAMGTDSKGGPVQPAMQFVQMIQRMQDKIASAGGVGSVTTLGAGITATPNPISGAGNLSVEWNAGYVVGLGYGLEINHLGQLVISASGGGGAWQAQTVTAVGPSLAIEGTTYGNGTLVVAPLSAASLLGNAGTGSAIPADITVGAGLALTETGTTAAGTLTLGTIAAGDVLANPGTVGAVPIGAPLGAGLTFLAGSLDAQWTAGNVGTVVGGTVSAGTLTVSGAGRIYAPVVNGDLPGPNLMADPYGQVIMAEIR